MVKIVALAILAFGLLLIGRSAAHAQPITGAYCLLTFTALTPGCVPASGGGTTNFLRADGNWAPPPGIAPAVYFAATAGVVCDGLTDTTTALQAAINAAGSGTIIQLPAGTCVVSSGLTLGNGSSTAASTVNNVILRGAGASSTFPDGTLAPGTTTTISYTGSGTAITVQGPLMGWGIQDLGITCTNSAAMGLSVVSAAWGDNRNLYIKGCATGISNTAVSALPSGLSTANDIHNLWRNISVQIPNVATGIGILMDGVQNVGDVTFNDWSNVSIVFGGSTAGNNLYGLYLKGCDSNTFKTFHFSQSATGSTDVAVELDYTGSTAWPAGNALVMFNYPSGVTGFQNNGSPASTNFPNSLSQLSLANSASYPSLPGLRVDYVGQVLIDTANLTSNSVTGSTTEAVLGSVYLPAKSIGAAVATPTSGSLEVECGWTVTANTDTKTLRIRWGSTGTISDPGLGSTNPISSASISGAINKTNAYVAGNSSENTTTMWGNVGSNVTVSTSTDNVTIGNPSYITCTGQLGTSTDTITLNYMRVRVFP